MADENVVASMLRGLADLVGGGAKESAPTVTPEAGVDKPQSLVTPTAPKDAVVAPVAPAPVAPAPVAPAPVTAEPRTAAMPVDVSAAPKSLTFEQIRGYVRQTEILSAN